MDSLLSFPLLLFSLFLCFLICLLFKQKTNQSKLPTLRLPPGPWPLPLIGNIHNIIRSLPHHAIRDLSRQYGPLMLLHIGQIPTVVVSSPDAAREIMKTHDINFASRPISTVMSFLSSGGKGIVFSPYGEYWRQVRKICVLELLSTKRVQSYRSIREEEVGNLINFISSSCASHCQPIDLSKRLTSLINGIITRATIGSKCKNQDVFLRELDMAMKLASGFDVADLFPSSRLARFVSRALKKAKRYQHVISRYLDEILEEHRQTKMFQGESEVEDLLGILLKLHEEDTLSNHLDMETVKAVLHDIVAAGTETSSTTLEWIMLELLKNPLGMRKVQSELREVLKGKTHVSESDLQALNYMHSVIKETLRLHPPTPFLLRQCRETCRIFDYDIAEGMTVLVNVWGIGRDPKYWEDSEEFKPERFMNNSIDFKGNDFEFLPFGSGRRICAGMSFGLVNVELPLASMLYLFDWKLADGLNPGKVDMSESFGVSCRPKTPLLLYAKPYKTDMGTQVL